MAGKGGGAWKVAYADFVTAMMAFFLVMWITSQDQKIKEAIQHYFVTPMGFVPIGERSPSPAGGIMESKSNGNLPDSQAVSMGRGRTPHSDDEGDGRNSKLVSDWLHADPDEYAYWKDNADRIRAAAASKSPDGADASVADAAAADRLARMLSNELHERMPLKEHSLYRDLLIESMTDVNWEEVAEDLISE